MKHALSLGTILILFVGPHTVFADPAADLYRASRTGDLAGVQALLVEQPDLARVQNESGETPLHYAVLSGNPAVVQALLAAGADATARDHSGRTPLHLAVLADDAKLIRMLVEAGSAVNAADAHGATPLHRAAARGKAQAVRALLSLGADVQARDAQGRTPLHVLGTALGERVEEARGELEALARLLVAHGADAAILAEGLPAFQPPTSGGTRDGYRTYAEIMQFLADRAAAYPSLCEYVDIGQSVQGRNLRALHISDNLGVEEDEPEFKYVSTMHGDEIVGNEMCLFFIDHLLTNYGTDPQITHLVDEIDIWIMPLMNPDGYVAGTRYNAHGVDLNRNFPEGSQGEPNTTAGREPETAAVMEWTWDHSFTLSANMHAGALVVNYPYDNDGMGSTFSPTPDEDLFVHISEAYSYYNPPMWNSPSFYHGITNGAAWYAITGGMQDWHYRYEGDNEVTLELSDVKSPPYSQIPGFWEDNRDSMLSYMSQCLIGVRGIVTDGYTGEPLDATVTVVGRDHAIYTDPDVGDYHRMLLPGTYSLRFEAAGYDPLTVENVVVSSGDATRLDVPLFPSARVTYPNGGEELPAGGAVDITWVGNPTARFQVQYTANYGQSGQTTDGFETGTLGPEYTTGGDADWFVTAGTVHAGSYAARGGDISHNQETWMTRTVGGGELSFWYRVSSESNYDFFNFYVDGDRLVHVSGESGWQHFSTTLPGGNHELKWEYTKDYSVSSGSDTAWIDDLSLVDDQTVWTDVVALTDPGATSVSWTPTDPGDSYKVRVRAYYGGSDYGDWDESDATFSVVSGFAPGDLNCNGVVDAFDIDPFILALTDPAAYADQYPGCNPAYGDINGDGTLNAFDIDPFIELLTGK